MQVRGGWLRGGVAALLLGVALVAGSSPAQQEITAAAKAIEGKIMSPFCPGYLLPDCPSAEARQLRELIHRKVAAGESEQQVLGYLVGVYGASILAEPPKEGFNLLVWSLPFLAIVIGGVAIVLITLLWTRRQRLAQSAGAEPAAAAHELGREASNSSDQAHAALKRKLERELKDYEF
ncbi:MAG: cytochrome c-type biogenesis protein CcmH [Candidatus Tectomicrobia bacterium]|nr:cytochrome c-type biogenesis protein CcmH [Candidatus Tectomicrobia bacterium]